MSARRIEDVLPYATPGWDPGVDSRRPDGLSNFESLALCRSEDEHCARTLISNLNWLHPSQRLPATRLAAKLRQGLDQPCTPAETFASRIYARGVRRRLISPIWWMAEDPANAPVAFVNLVRTRMWVPGDCLLSQAPRLLKQRFVNDFNHSGVTQARGWLIGTLDAEFDDRRGGYEFHTALIVSGEKVAALEKLRDLGSYDRGRREDHELDMREFDRVQVQRDLDNLPDPLTYATKMRVFNRQTYISREDVRERSQFVSRIPQPDLSHWLLWMDRVSLSELLITQGLRCTPDGFRSKNFL